MTPTAYESIVMPKMLRKSKRLGIFISIPGGWKAQVPQVMSANDALLHTYAAYFMDSGIGSPTQALQAAAETVQATYAHGYIDGLKEAVARRSQEYAAKYPELRRVVGRQSGIAVVELLGFKPEMIQAAYVPFQHTGRTGQAFVAQMLSDMAQDYRNEQITQKATVSQESRI